MTFCDRFIDGFSACALRGVVEDRALVEHLQGCSACQMAWRRLERISRGLRSLPEQSAPDALAGGVVAAMHAGRCQDRAVEALHSLARIGTPPELSRAVRSEVGEAPEAPAVLDRLLEEQLDDPGQAATRRASSRLRRVPAPPELARRLQVSLLEPAPGLLRRAGWRSLMAAITLVAAGLVVRIGIDARRAALEARGEPIAEIEFRQSTGLEVDEATHAMLDGISGGFLSLLGGTR